MSVWGGTVVAMRVVSSRVPAVRSQNRPDKKVMNIQAEFVLSARADRDQEGTLSRYSSSPKPSSCSDSTLLFLVRLTLLAEALR